MRGIQDQLGKQDLIAALIDLDAVSTRAPNTRSFILPKTDTYSAARSSKRPNHSILMLTPSAVQLKLKETGGFMDGRGGS